MRNDAVAGTRASRPDGGGFQRRWWRVDRGAAELGLAALLLPVVVLASVGGFVLQRSWGDDGVATVELPDNRYSAPVLACPGGPPVAVVHNGDRVFAIGVHDESDEWLLIRNPVDPTEHWYVEARWVNVDAATDDLPPVGCDQPVPAEDGDTEVAVEPDETTTTTPDESTTTNPDESTTTTRPNETTTTTPATPTTQSTTPTTRPTTPTTSTTPTTQPQPPKPTIGNVSASNANIWETVNGNPCTSPQPATSTVVASAVGNATSVTMTWSGPVPGSKTMQNANGAWTATLGPFTDTALAYPQTSASVTVTVTASGPGGTSAPRTVSVTLHDCDFPI